nr:hypothetical protein [Tanacetum cinerariifolium]
QLCLHPQSPIHLSTLIPSQGKSIRGADEELSDRGSPRVIMYGYDGLPMQPVPYVPMPEHLEYLVPSKDEAPIEDEPLPADASPTALSPGYVVESDEDEDPFEDEDDDEEEDEHLAPSDSSVVPTVDPVLSAGDTKAFETDEAQKTIRLEPPMSASMKARIAEHAVAPIPPLPISSLQLPLPSPLTTSPTNTGVPLGYMAAGIRMRALLPSTSHMTDVPEVEMPPQKRACFTTPTLRLEIGKSLATDVARQSGPTLEADLRRDRVEGMGYGIIDTWDEIVEAMMEIALTTLEGVNQRVTKLATTARQETEEFQVRFKEAQDDRGFWARVNTLFMNRPFHRHTVMLLDREATYACRAWAGSEDR